MWTLVSLVFIIVEISRFKRTDMATSTAIDIDQEYINFVGSAIPAYDCYMQHY